MSDRFQPSTYEAPASDALVAFMRDGWRRRRRPRRAAAGRRPGRCSAGGGSRERFAGERLVIPAGALTPRANDTDYRFRADTAHVYLTGNQSSDAVLVIDDGEPTLYFRPAPRQGRRRVLARWAVRRGLVGPAPVAARGRDALRPALPPRVRPPRRAGRARPSAGAARRRSPTSTRWSPPTPHDGADAELAVVPVGDAARQGRVGDRPAAGRRSTPRRSGSRTPSASGTTCSSYGERWIEGTFWRRARADGNDVGYESHLRRRPARRRPCTGSTTTDRSRRAS